MIRVTAAIFIRSGKIFIAKRKPTGKMPGLWEFPGGKIEEGETPEQCLRRELCEEFEIDAEVGEHVGTNVHRYDFGTIELMVYRAKILDGEVKLNDHAEAAWVGAEEIGGFEFAPADVPFVEMIRSGQFEVF